MTKKKPFDQKIADEICERLTNGESLTQICKTKGIPGRKLIHKWLNEVESFRNEYIRAREEQADYFLDNIIDISQDDKKTSDQKRIEIDTKKWVMGKLKPKKYGDRQTIEHESTQLQEILERANGKTKEFKPETDKA